MVGLVVIVEQQQPVGRKVADDKVLPSDYLSIANPRVELAELDPILRSLASSEPSYDNKFKSKNTWPGKSSRFAVADFYFNSAAALVATATAAAAAPIPVTCLSSSANSSVCYRK